MQSDAMRVSTVLFCKFDSDRTSFIGDDGSPLDHALILGTTNPDLKSLSQCIHDATERALLLIQQQRKQQYQLFIQQQSQQQSQQQHHTANEGKDKETLSESPNAPADITSSLEADLSKSGSSQSTTDPFSHFLSVAPSQFSSSSVPVEIATKALTEVETQFISNMKLKALKTWEKSAMLCTYEDCVKQAITKHPHILDCEETERTWKHLVSQTDRSFASMRRVSSMLGLNFYWSHEKVRTLEGRYRVKVNIETTIRRALEFAPYSDVLWLESLSSNLNEAKHFAEAIHEKHPHKILAYSLAPSLEWGAHSLSQITSEELANMQEFLRRIGFTLFFIPTAGLIMNALGSQAFLSQNVPHASTNPSSQQSNHTSSGTTGGKSKDGLKPPFPNLDGDDSTDSQDHGRDTTAMQDGTEGPSNLTQSQTPNNSLSTPRTLAPSL